ncbi:MAG: FMN-binding protein [Chloroflexota bacterium]|nr:FMN-binding protein [Chloroflexota bacterium]
MSLSPQPKKRPGKKITGGLVALSSAAIVTVYAAGYTQTQSAEAQFDSPIATVSVSPTSVPPTVQIATATAAIATRTPFRPITLGPTATAPTPTVVPLPRLAPTAVGTSTPASVATATSVPKTASASGAYRDGSYVGLGRSRHGNIEVTVTVQDGKIAAAKISQCLTRYPCSMIGALPGEVVAQQSASVDYVSGATDSSTAFKDAVANALAKAS